MKNFTSALGLLCFQFRDEPSSVDLAHGQRFAFILGVLVLLNVSSAAKHLAPDHFQWHLHSRADLSSSIQEQIWEASHTALIVCDMWGYHHSVNALRRLKSFAPRLNDVLSEAHRRGAIIIHASSDCMPFYGTHLTRRRALATNPASDSPTDIARWCHRIPTEEQATYHLDQTNGGEDDDLQEHAKWAIFLKSIGRNPGTPWQSQMSLITIDAYRGYICAEGDVVSNVLEANDITHGVLTGVHLIRCVPGRPFGLRQMKRGGKSVASMRDMTDVMYEPNSWPYVSHFSGLHLVIEHIERHVCPTVTSDQLLDGKPFQFHEDRRPIIAVSSATAWDQELRRQFQVRLLGADSPATECLEAAALWLTSDGALSTEAITAFSDTGKPIISDASKAWSHFGVSNGFHALTSKDFVKREVESNRHPILQEM